MIHRTSRCESVCHSGMCRAPSSQLNAATTFSINALVLDGQLPPTRRCIWMDPGCSEARCLSPSCPASMIHVHRKISVPPHVGYYCIRTPTEHPEDIRHSSRVSSQCTSNIVAHDEFLSFCGEAIAREQVSGNTSPRPSCYKRICLLW